MKIKLLYLLVPVVIAPICLTATSCNAFGAQKVKNLGDLLTGFGSYGSTGSYNKSFQSLYYGNKKVNNGNYVVFFGTSGKSSIKAADNTDVTNTTPTLYPNLGLSMFSQDVKNWVNSDVEDINNSLTCIGDARIVDDVQTWKNDEHEYNISFFSFFYDCKETSYIHGAQVNNSTVDKIDTWFACSPFQTWTKDDFCNPQYNISGESDYTRDKKYWNNWEKNHEEGKYIRNDQSAKNYRELVTKLWALSPESLGTKTGEDAIVALYYKNGSANSVKTYNSDSGIYSDLAAVYPENTLKDGNK